MVKVTSLDIGCGSNKQGDIGIDLTKDSNADVIADAHYLPFRDESFDLVKSNNVLEHSPNPLSFLKEQYRVLRNNARIELITDNAQWYRWSVLRSGGLRHEDYYNDHYMIFYPKNVERLMTLAGFKTCTTTFIELPRQKRIMNLVNYMVQLLVHLRILRKESMYYRFLIVGSKPK